MATANINASEKIEQYIEGMPEFAKQVCVKLRQIILKAVPGIKEDWKWGPNYNYNGMVCGYGGFKNHVKFTFFNGSEMSDSKGLFNHCVDNEFSRSIKYTDVSEIDEKTLTSYIRESAEINSKGWKRVVKDKTVDVPPDLTEALKPDTTAFDFFENLSYGYKKEYVEWITSAKQEKTRADRIAKTVAMCAAGRKLNDKYH
jgi:uncharacterized protein YdeI (YjbR/CyaY-like superfamily)